MTKQLLVLLAVVSTHCWRPDFSAAGAPKGEKYRLLIEGLANKNSEPRITKSGKPLFLPSYDWQEANRVRTLYIELLKNDSEALWEEMVKHLGDDRYSLTIGKGDVGAHNYSVGLLCLKMAHDRLEDAFSDTLPDNEEGRPVYPELGIWDDLGAWRRQRGKKSLFELQVDACELAVEKLMAEPDLSQTEKREVRQRIHARIAELNRTKKPVFRKPTSFEFEWYDADSGSTSTGGASPDCALCKK